MTKKKDPLQKFMPERKAKAKSIYTMVKFDNYPDLLAFMLGRCKKLNRTKQDYFIGLIRQDMEAQNGKK